MNDATAAAVAAAQQAMEATSLLERVKAMHAYVSAELDAITARQSTLSSEQLVLRTEIAETNARVATEQQQLDTLMREAYRGMRTSPLEALLGSGSLVDGLVHVAQLADVGDQERQTVEELRSLRAELDTEQTKLAADQRDLDTLAATVQAKRDGLVTLEARAKQLVDAQPKGDAARARAEIDVVSALADEQAKADRELQDIIAKIVPGARTGAGVSVWPADGAVSQPFGPSTLGLEPPLQYRGVTYPHFHPAIDIAAALLTPVLAAANGRVSFVGHTTDGAEVILIAHPTGYVSLYAHLDDSLRPPLVRVGDDVTAGQAIGAVGMTGITTGPHLHFGVVDGTTPIDPRSVLPPR